MNSRNVYSDSDILSGEEKKEIKQIVDDLGSKIYHELDVLEERLTKEHKEYIDKITRSIEELEVRITNLEQRMRNQEDKDYYELNGH